MAKSNVSIYVLRRNLDQFPKRDSCNPGDTVILPSGDILIWSKKDWILLPGRFITVEELKEFVGYISSGWPDTSELFIQDMSSYISNKDFLTRASEICPLVSEAD